MVGHKGRFVLLDITFSRTNLAYLQRLIKVVGASLNVCIILFEVCQQMKIVLLMVVFVEFSMHGLLRLPALKTFAPVVHRFWGDTGCQTAHLGSSVRVRV